MSEANTINLTEAGREKLVQIVTRIERLEEEKSEIGEQIKDVYGEAKSMGYDTKVLRKLIARRRMDRDEIEEMEAILDVYMLATGDL